MGPGLSADRRRSLCAREFRKLGFSVSDPYPAPCPLPAQMLQRHLRLVPRQTDILGGRDRQLTPLPGLAHVICRPRHLLLSPLLT